ncbi:2OG-Fe dioxygenase family protein [Ideonella sp.]|uniref:2OG-Fe dioxygenase family protein n=1 Tax=Ideonella sp. TaxID=1929293 RepID=UPI0035B37276
MQSPSASDGGRPARGRGDGWLTRQARWLASDGLLHMSSAAVAKAVRAEATAWRSFAAHWDRLALDHFMGDGGTYRLRRYGALACRQSSAWQQLPHTAYRQAPSVNPLNGGIDRLFEPLEASFVQHPMLRSLIELTLALIHHSEGQRSDWKVELHPYRILARPDCPGQPTPEGLHRDGVDYTAALMVRRANIKGADTRVADTDHRELQRLRLRAPMDLLLLDDVRTLHEVSPVVQRKAHAGAWRDVLVLAYTRWKA